MGNVQVKRKHEICMGHRVVGHEGKCRHLHGHNYVFNFVVEHKGGMLDDIGRVVDFSVVKSILCEWLEIHWDHKFMHHIDDSVIKHMTRAFECEFIDMGDTTVTAGISDTSNYLNSLVEVDFNPTAENIAQYFVDVVAPSAFRSAGHPHLELVELTLEETSKCHVTYTKR